MTDLTTPSPDQIDGVIVEAEGGVPEESLWRIRARLLWRAFKRNWRLFAKNKAGLFGLGIIIFFGLMAILQPVFMATIWDKPEYRAGGFNIFDPVNGSDTVLIEKTVVEEVTDPLTQIDFIDAQIAGVFFPEEGMKIQVAQSPAPPNSRHWLGTDPFGGDILSQLMFGARAAFTLGAIAALSAVFLATMVGSVAAYYGKWVDSWLMRQADFVLLMPLLPLLIVISSFYRINLVVLGLLIGTLAGLGGTAIILKSQALTVTVKPYIDAARIAGGGSAHIIFRHIVPNVLPLSFLYMMFEVTSAIFLEATLSFFGLLAVEQSWGLMINIAHTQGYTLQGLRVWWLMIPAGLSITLFAGGFFLVGRAMDEVVNPRLRAR